MLRTQASAPLRIDLAGGTLDIWPLYLVLPEPAVTVNAALDLRSRAVVEPSDDVVLVSVDQGAEARYRDLDALRRAQASGACPLPLLAEAALAVSPAGGVSLTTSAAGPAGSGLGGSSALLAAVLGALLEAEGRRPGRRALQSLAQDVETRVLGKPTGYQDYFPALYGGCLAIEGAPGGLRVEPLDIDPDALSRRLRLVYTGLPHASGITNWGVIRAYLDGEPQTVAALRELAVISREARGALRAGDLDGALAAVVADGAVRRRMAPGVTTPEIEALDAAVREAGALGTKVCGAGGGGCVLIALGDRDGAAVDAALAAHAVEPMALRFEPAGLSVERA
jgi:D-glycero-alpha-D-manno-heptose-7-phosphate kinase